MDAKIKENLLTEFKQKCRDRRLKITPQRTIIYEELINSLDHPSVDILYGRVKKKLPDISFDTVYRTLMTFNTIGIADIVEGINTSKRYDGNTNQHYHFICVKCGAITDITDVPFRFEIPEQIKQKYNPRSVKIFFEGLCGKC
ncbi:MAG: transcriptional repressor [Actinobacteria bacterium]|nr:transcriptional repressor [Actinomycetota bacterium]